MKPFDVANTPLAGLNLIEASAGTGKTYTLTSLVVRLIVEQDIPITRILVVTFTEAATAELKGRIRERLTELLSCMDDQEPTKDPLVQKLRSGERSRAKLRITNALRVLDEAAVHTIHGFCYRMLQEHAFESGLSLDAELVVDQLSLVREAVRIFWSRYVLSMPDTFLDYLEAANIWPNRFESFYRAISGHPEVELQVGDTGSEDADVDVRGPYSSARQLWQSRQEEIRAVLVDSIDNLKKNKGYRAQKLPSWFREFDGYFASADRVGLTPPNGLVKLTSSAIEDGTKKGCDRPVHPFFDLAEELVFALGQNNELNGQRLARLYEIAAEELPTLMTSIKQKQGLLSFDDLLDLMHKGCRNAQQSPLVGTVSRRFGAVLIDEFQDTDTRQYDIFRALFLDGKKPFFVIGDPKQSIYRFRGADIYAYLNARDDAKKNSFTLDTNWRSDPSLVLAIERLFSRDANPFLEEKISFGRVTAASKHDTPLLVNGQKRPAFELGSVLENNPSETDERHGNPWVRAHVPYWVAGDVQRILEQGELGGAPVLPFDIAVLVRSNKEVEALAEAIEGRGIPVVMSSETSVYLTPEANDLHGILLAIAHPERKGLIRTALASDLFGFSAADIAGLEENAHRYETVNLVFRRWNRLWGQGGILPVLEEVLANRLAGEGRLALTRLLSYNDGPRRFAALRQLTESVHAAEQRFHLKMHALCRWIEIKRERSDVISDDEQLTCLGNEGAVRVMTYHKAKGLEFGIVYCPFVSTGRSGGGSRTHVVAHKPGERNQKVLFWGSDAPQEYKIEEAREEKAEEMRILYVALTRARHYAQVVWGPFKTLHDSSMGRLLHPLGDDETPSMRKTRLTKNAVSLLGDELVRLADESSGTIGLRSIHVRGESHPYNSTDDSLRLKLLEPSCRRKQTLVWTSFSSLVAVSDEQSEPLVAKKREADEDAQMESLFNDLDRGMVAGSFLHKIYEDIDFNLGNLDEVVAKHLRNFGFAGKVAEAQLSGAIVRTMQTHFGADDDGPFLAALNRSRVRKEWEFTLGLGLDSGMGIKPQQLAKIAARYHCAETGDGYGEKVSALYTGELAGFLRGFIDLVFEFEGRYYLADYKSNYLGPTIGHYSAANMRDEMENHHYVLQSLFYSFALHRHLASTVDGYDCEKHFGGAYFLFLRGMHPQASGRYGVYFHRASGDLFDEMEKILQGGTP